MERTTSLPFIALLLFGFTDLTPARLECEITAETLQDCCLGLEYDVFTCGTGSGPGCGRTISPAFDVETSECLQELSCAEMQVPDDLGRTFCDRVAQALEERQDELDVPEDELESTPSDGPLGRIEGLCP